MITVKTKFILHPEQYKDGAGHPDSQTGDVEEGMNPMSPDISKGGFEVVGKHFKWLRAQGARLKVVVIDYLFYF
jgi:hypothetical protein